MAVRIGAKYGNRRVEEDGWIFDSKAERMEYLRLKFRLCAGEIADLKIHPRYTIVVNGMRVCAYVADFQHREVATGELVVTDVKGKRTAVYALKKKLMAACLQIAIREVAA